MHHSDPRALVVDHTVLNLRFLRETLAGFWLGHVDTSSDAEYAFELALKKDYTFFILNVKTPILPGPLLYELLRKVYDHSTPQRPLPPTIYITDDMSLRSADLASLKLQPGVRDVLHAPFKIQRLLQALHRCVPPHTLRSNPASPPNQSHPPHPRHQAA